MTLRDWIIKGQDILKDSDIEDYENDTRVLAMFAFDISYTDMFMKMTEEMPDEDAEFFMDCINLRATHMPCQYITGSQEFMGYEFGTEDGVLIPRQETELLVEKALELTSGRKSVKALDMCTGSGCIGISYELKRRENKYKDDEVHLADISDDAIYVAEKNKYKLGTKCSIIKTDLFENIKDRYDIIMSNPPYIKSDVIGTLEPEVRDHEPRIALDGLNNGLYFYNKIIPEAASFLAPGGMLFFEIGYDQGEEVSGLMKNEGYVDVNIVKDYSGLDRVVYGTKSVLM